MTPYREIAKEALINWNGLTEAEALEKANNESVRELEGQVYALNSIKYAVVGLAEVVKLNEEQATSFFEASVFGPEDAEIVKLVTEKARGLTNDEKLQILTTIHDGWVKDNSSEKTFNKKKDRKQLRQYAPLELIGWNEVESDLLFLDPILSSIEVDTNRVALRDAYHQKVEKYLRENNVDSRNALESLVSRGSSYYSALPEDLEMRLSLETSTVTDQIIANWSTKDQESLRRFESVKGK